MSARDDLILALRKIEGKVCDDYCSGEADMVPDCPTYSNRTPQDEGPESVCPGRTRYLRDREEALVDALVKFIGDQEIEDAVTRARHDVEALSAIRLSSPAHAGLSGGESCREK